MYALWVHARDINNQAEADAVIARAKATGITDIFFQLLDGHGRAHYNPTPPFQKSTSLGTFDPLAYLAASSIRAHAWFCVATDILFVHPEYNVKKTKSLSDNMPDWADFTLQPVRQFATDWCSAVAKAYPTVGIHLDYIRWNTDFGDAKLSWATGSVITQTVQQIHAAIPSTTAFGAAVGTDPMGSVSHSWQEWGNWTSMMDYFAIMAYPANLADLQSTMARSAAYPKSQIAVGLSGLCFDTEPPTRITPNALTQFVTWARSAGYVHFAWFDYDKINEEQYKVIAQLKPTDGTVNPSIKDLNTLAQTLRARADEIDTQAKTLATQAINLRTQADKAVSIAQALAQAL